MSRGEHENTVKVVRLHRFGGPEALQLDEVAGVVPGAGEVSIDVAAFGLNRVEVLYREGGFGPVQFPARIGYEAAGVIAAVGEGVTNWAPGDRVAVLPGLSMERYGTYGERILYPADMLVAVPASQSLRDAAASYMQYLTAYALISAGGIAAGDRVVITAASSSVGLAAIQITRAAGATPIAVTRSRDKVQDLYRLGAAHVVVSEEEDVADCLRGLAPDGVDVVFDAVGGDGLLGLVSSLRSGGILILYGTLAGDAIALPAHLLMLRNLTLRGFSANAVLEDPRLRDRALTYISEGLSSGTLRPVVDRVFPLSAIGDAHRYLESNAQIGKVLVMTGGDMDSAVQLSTVANKGGSCHGG